MRRQYAAALIAVGLLLGVVSSASSDAGDITWDGVPTAPFTTADPSTVTLNVSAVDTDASATFPATCLPAAPFAFGVTSVTCTATLGDGTTQVQTSFNVEIDQPAAVTFSSPLPSPTAKAGPAGVSVDYAPPTAKLGSTSLTVTCDPAPKATFHIGTTPVTCTATDGTTSGKASFDVVVTQASGPSLTMPGDETVEATSGSGATVNYPDPTVHDADDPGAAAHCTPSPGGFGFGTTHVSCTVTDAFGLSASGSFSVTVGDSTPPALTVPPDQHVGATGKTTPVTFTATATDAVDPSPAVSCSPASGSQFPVGSTSVGCTATDNHGNTSAQKSFAVVVVDGAPTVAPAPPVTVEANGPSGSVVTYTAPAATDTADGSGLLVTCAPASGATFPLGTTTVSCHATNSSNQTGTTSFPVTVQDTTPPSLPTPGAITLTAGGGVAASDAHIVAYLALKATDLVDPSPKVVNDAPSVFPIGTTTVHFTATDSSGNVTKGSGTVTVAMPPPGQPAPASPVQTASVDRTAPGNVSGLRVSVTGRAVLLQWHPPSDADFDHVEIDRSLGAASPVTVYKGAAATFTDRRLTPGTAYRYLIVSFDKTGNESTGIVALATVHSQLLYAPLFGARLTPPVILRWKPVAKAAFYNVQLYHRGTKIMSVFPRRTKLVVGSHWTFGKHTYELKPGTYSWYIWPALGSRAKPRFASLEGFSTFTVARP